LVGLSAQSRDQNRGRGAPTPKARVLVGAVAIALPSNESMELTINSVTPFAYAKAAPLLLAADPRC
jgi:hypothetical protein